MSESPAHPQDSALLLLGPGCPHCAALVASLTTLVEAGTLGRLELVNVARHPEQAAAFGVKSVPWLRLGEFELYGRQSTAELARWLALSGTDKGWAVYFDTLFSAGQRQRVEAMVQAEPARLRAFPLLLADPEVGINTRLGIGVVLEALQGSGLLHDLVHPLGAVSRSNDARLRGDACYYLGLTGRDEAAPYLRERLLDENTDVREIAEESLQTLMSGVDGWPNSA